MRLLVGWFSGTQLGLWFIIKTEQARERRRTKKQRKEVLHARTRAKISS